MIKTVSRFVNRFRRRNRRRGCGADERNPANAGLRKVLIVGSPNVGKSLLFNRLTGTYVTVSNYSGTTVEVSRGKARIGREEFEIVDTPGMYSLLPISEEERVARDILFKEKPAAVIHIVDAKNLEKMLPLTLQLIEAGLPVILVLNIIDEAEKIGMQIDTNFLQAELGVPVAATVSTTGKGIDILKREIEEYAGAERNNWHLGKITEDALWQIERLLSGDYGLSKRVIGLLLLQDDSDIIARVEKNEPDAWAGIKEVISRTKQHYHQPMSYIINLRYHQESLFILEQAVMYQPEARTSFREVLSRIMINPVTGVPILLLILYFGIYKFVGKFGAGTVVDFIEAGIFEKYVNPSLTKLFTSIIPWKVVSDLFVGEYGMITLGFRYAVALILPIVSTFFIAFAVLEDTGYLPRLALLIDRLFKKIGLTGRAVIPMVLGLGCDTMATMVTRTLPSKRERIIATLLLALAVPCSAQLGVILALLEGNAAGLWIWVGIICLVFLLIGFLSSLILPGDAPSFYMEIPPLRLPRPSNVLIKTYARVKWYFIEIFPMFILASLLIWVGQITGVFGLLTRAIEYPVRWIGLPDNASVAFLFGFFRRDYGAAGLYDIKKAGLFTGTQLVVACVTLTLFLPCVAQFLMNVKERGWKTGLGISAFILIFSFSVGFLVNLAFVLLGVQL